MPVTVFYFVLYEKLNISAVLIDMSSPPKPWNNVGACGHNFPASNTATERSLSGVIGNPAFLQSSSAHLPSGGSGVRNQYVSQVPPPIPPRPDTMSSSYRYGVGCRGYSPYSSYSSPLYSGLYRSYGGMGYGSRMPYSTNFYGTSESENDLIRFAEESTRPAFQSIESVVHAVGSVSMMLESTFHALYSSYQAVLGVADQFTRLRNHLTHILSTLAVLRSLQWLCLKILYHLGVRTRNPSNESAWSAASELASGSVSVPYAGGPPKSSWPIFIFLSVVLGAPWVILRLLSKAAEVKKKEVHLWASGSDKSNMTNVGVVAYDFMAQYPQELSVRAGQKIVIAPKHLQPKSKGWLFVSADGKKVGLVPSNYVKIACLNKSKQPVVAAPAGGITQSSTQISTLQKEVDIKEPAENSSISSSGHELK